MAGKEVEEELSDEVLCSLVPAPMEAEEAEEVDIKENDTKAGQPMHHPTIAEIKDVATRMLTLSVKVKALGEEYCLFALNKILDLWTAISQ